MKKLGYNLKLKSTNDLNYYGTRDIAMNFIRESATSEDLIKIVEVVFERMCEIDKMR